MSLDQLVRALQGDFIDRASLASSLPLQCDVAILTMILTITAAATAITYYCYSCSSLSKSSRARKEGEKGTAAVARNGNGGGDGVPSLPSPAPLLPRWLGFIGGHTLQIAREEVRD